MRWWLLPGLILGLFAPPVAACVNAIGTDHHGRRFELILESGDALVDDLRGRRARADWLATAPKVVAEARRSPHLRPLTDLAIVLMYQGRYADAIALLLQIERRFPGRPETAGNLGTALELAGYDRVALRWIRIGIHRDPDEHEGSEWLHVRILEAKLAERAHPGTLASHSIAGLGFDPVLVPAIPSALPAGNRGQPVTPTDLNLALFYQLSERMNFVTTPDRVVANLLDDWATLNLAGGPLETADSLYGLARVYGAPATPLIARRRAYMRAVMAQAADREPQGSSCAICPR